MFKAYSGCLIHKNFVEIIVFQTSKPPPLAKWQALFQPFHPTTWFFYIATVGVIFVIAILHALVVFNHDFKYKFDMLQFTYQLLLDNGSPRLSDVHTQNLRVYYTILLLCSFVLTASYKGDSLLILKNLFFL